MGRTGAIPKEDVVRPQSKEFTGISWVELPPEGNKLQPPRMPEVPQYIGESWSDYAKSMWIRLWQSPESTQWNREDTEAVARYVELHELAGFNGWKSTDLNAVQQFEDRFGLSPWGKRRMYWRIRPNDDIPTMYNIAPVKSIKGEELR